MSTRLRFLAFLDWLVHGDPIYVEHYGAFGDGIHDDSDAVRYAIEAAVQQKRPRVWMGRGRPPTPGKPEA